MFRLLWFVVKLSFLVGAAVWLALRPGEIAIEWLDYRATTRAGYLFLALGIVFFAFWTLFRAVSAIFGLFGWARRFRERKLRERGQRALLRGLAAVAAGDAKAAGKEARRARDFMPSDTGLVPILEAQAARMRGDRAATRAALETLLASKDAAFIGVRGLIQLALESGAPSEAVAAARRALELQPRQGWLLKLVYDLEIRMRDWAAAEKTLRRALRAGAIPAQQAKSDRVAMAIARADAAAEKGAPDEALREVKNACALDPAFVPAVARLARAELEQGRRRRALARIERAWKTNPHPDLAALWEKAAPDKAATQSAARMKWVQRLVDLNPQSEEGHIALARAAMACQLWGEARYALEQVEKIRPCPRLFALAEKLEERSGLSMRAGRSWSGLASDAAPERVWLCRRSGAIYAHWSPVAEPHGAFNSIVWDVPASGLPAMRDEILGALEPESLLRAPQGPAER